MIPLEGLGVNTDGVRGWRVIPLIRRYKGQGIILKGRSVVLQGRTVVLKGLEGCTDPPEIMNGINQAISNWYSFKGILTPQSFCRCFRRGLGWRNSFWRLVVAVTSKGCPPGVVPSKPSMFSKSRKTRLSILEAKSSGNSCLDCRFFSFQIITSLFSFHYIFFRQ